jgi:hypothetical protein
MSFYFNETNPANKETFIKYLQDYKNINSKKLKIISVIRKPTERLLSSFFQSFHNDEIMFSNKKELETTIITNTIESLLEKYKECIINDKLPGGYESLYEMSNIFELNILDNLIKKHNHYYLNHDLFELFVLDFNKLIADNSLSYLNMCLNIRLNEQRPLKKVNSSKNKIYRYKYEDMKKKIPIEVNNIIESRYKNIINLFE